MAGPVLALAYRDSAYRSSKFEVKKLISPYSKSLQDCLIQVSIICYNFEKTVPAAKASKRGSSIGGYFNFME